MAKRRSHQSPVSGRFVLRLEPGHHAALRAAARAAGASLNEYCRRKLAAPLGALASLGPAADLVEHAARLHCSDLVGMVAFGSWARGEAGPGSDVDVLVVLDSRAALTRQLYRPWDEAPITWGGFAVEPHLVHLPTDDHVGTIWAEAAIDGIVLFERDLAVSRALVSVRQAIVAGRLVRRTIHGQPYWAEVA
jgi:predicted nucleotidyltransferase